jgi:ferredoxin--NADP+ reductase
LDVDGERVGRPYSLVNAPGANARWRSTSTRSRKGPLTPRLSDLEVGDRIWVADKASGVFTLDNVVSRKHLWMLATGTALGVYLSMLKTDEAWDRFERIILVHGARNTGELNYDETIAELQRRAPDKFTFITALTREVQRDLPAGPHHQLLENGELQAAAMRTSTRRTAT